LFTMSLFMAAVGMSTERGLAAAFLALDMPQSFKIHAFGGKRGKETYSGDEGDEPKPVGDSDPLERSL